VSELILVGVQLLIRRVFLTAVHKGRCGRIPTISPRAPCSTAKVSQSAIWRASARVGPAIMHFILRIFRRRKSEFRSGRSRTSIRRIVIMHASPMTFYSSGTLPGPRIAGQLKSATARQTGQRLFYIALRKFSGSAAEHRQILAPFRS